MKREQKIEKIADIIQSHVGYFNGWWVDDESERESCERAAKKIFIKFIK